MVWKYLDQIWCSWKNLNEKSLTAPITLKPVGKGLQEGFLEVVICDLSDAVDAMTVAMTCYIICILVHLLLVRFRPYTINCSTELIAYYGGSATFVGRAKKVTP